MTYAESLVSRCCPPASIANSPDTRILHSCHREMDPVLELRRRPPRNTFQVLLLQENCFLLSSSTPLCPSLSSSRNPRHEVPKMPSYWPFSNFFQLGWRLFFQSF